MQLARPTYAPDPRVFGRGRIRELAPPPIVAPAIGDDLKLFALTFVVGFVFVSVLLA